MAGRWSISAFRWLDFNFSGSIIGFAVAGNDCIVHNDAMVVPTEDNEVVGPEPMDLRRGGVEGDDSVRICCFGIHALLLLRILRLYHLNFDLLGVDEGRQARDSDLCT
ncbi:hypothetical protein O6P43_007414 [Quillaja saponaria]|uniref:Uncharacterized protein n=1 Tax=Quillaja saponaria TaxID=32244 RepID=A0AAD7QAK6_QUISA|nr:hypothetical protein O6P43_007414 [Quillaja saponaria]